MFGYATNETPELMPAPVSYAHQLSREVTRLRKSGELKWLRPDAKTQVSCEYVGDKVKHINAVVISTQHAECATNEEIKSAMRDLVINKVLPAELIDANTCLLYTSPSPRDQRGSRMPSSA